MLLAIDAGNTNVVFALLEGREVRARWRIATDPRRTADEYVVWLSQLLDARGPRPSATSTASSSAPSSRARCTTCRMLAHQVFRQRGDDRAGEGGWPFQLDVEEPHSLGADRALNVIAAHAAHPGDLIVVDFGTATTFDVIDYSGAYKGGIIAPGINLSLDALVTAAAKLPRIAIEAPSDNLSVIGRNTVDQMHIGIFWGYVAMIEGLIARMKAEVGRPVKVIATGGLAVAVRGAHARFSTRSSMISRSSDWRWSGSVPIYRPNVLRA